MERKVQHIFQVFTDDLVNDLIVHNRETEHHANLKVMENVVDKSHDYFKSFYDDCERLLPEKDLLSEDEVLSIIKKIKWKA
jgi:hypothetical protein